MWIRKWYYNRFAFRFVCTLWPMWCDTKPNQTKSNRGEPRRTELLQHKCETNENGSVQGMRQRIWCAQYIYCVWLLSTYAIQLLWSWISKLGYFLFGLCSPRIVSKCMWCCILCSTRQPKLFVIDFISLFDFLPNISTIHAFIRWYTHIKCDQQHKRTIFFIHIQNNRMDTESCHGCFIAASCGSSIFNIHA